ncbi:Thyrotropin-releasing hormone receptor [Toxocara canis]|uniref:Thyrotropin-releasing hormone receptor n=1 Tax=Toxocara canis TaxID=6265 RepID=A0A0B2VRI9_TOXCA|nr:Thyrotropin-releasing hormone receptor [Toxocara canis]
MENGAAVSSNELELEDDPTCMFGDCYLKPFSDVYDHIHIPLSLTICVFGTVSNVFNIIVLTRKRMRTPINVLLAGLSFSQWMLASNYLGLLTVEYYRMQCYSLPWTYAFAWYRLINVNCNVVFHTVAFSHTLVIAVFRYGALRWPIQASRYLYRTELAVITTCVIWLVVPIICSPIFFTSQVGEIQVDYMNCSLQVMFDLNYSENATLVKFVFWMFGIVVKLIPSTLLSFLLIALIRSLHNVEKRRNLWHKRNEGCDELRNSMIRSKRNFMSTTRKTRMLVIILFLCVAVELPHGVLNLCTGIYGESFGIRIYDHLGSFMEMLTLLYSSISFVLYCSMSNDFLCTFQLLFCACVCEPNNGANTHSHGPNEAFYGQRKRQRSLPLSQMNGYLCVPSRP